MVSLFGTWMQTTALGFLMFELTRSPLYLGYTGFATGVPAWVLMLYGGVVSDRFPRRTVLIVSQAAMMALAFVLAALAFTGAVRPWQILALAFLLGIANAFDAPARQSFVVDLVGREDLTNAIALNATMFNTATAVGPAVAGITYELFGPGWCFALNGLSFLAVLAALSAMRMTREPTPARRTSAHADLKEAVAYVTGDPIIRTLMGIVGVTSGVGISIMTLVPAWAVTVLHGTASTNGWLQSARGMGALAAALFIASRSRAGAKGRLLTTGTLAFPAALVLFAAARWLPVSMLLLAGVGAAVILVVNLCNALIQTLSPDAMRGRVMSVYTLVFFGLTPLGSLWMGATAGRVGEPVTLVLAAGIALAAALAVLVFAPRIRALR